MNEPLMITAIFWPSGITTVADLMYNRVQPLAGPRSIFTSDN
jgi:hypothetical protein